MFNTHGSESTLFEFRGEGPQTGIPCSARLSGDCLNFMEANPEAIEVKYTELLSGVSLKGGT